MTRRRTIIVISTLFISVVCVTFGWQYWVITGKFKLIEWSIDEGGLTLSYMPGKGPVSTTLYIDAGYVRGCTRTWVMKHPGATNRFIGAPSVPTPEDLFKSARIPTGKSDSIGLCNIYNDVGDAQKESIVANLQYETEKHTDVRKAIQKLFDSGNYPWLTKVLHEQ